LVVILHGYYFNPGYVIAGFQMESFFEDIGVLTIAPEGLVNLTGNHFWNGSPSCCDFFGSNVDDVAYLSTLIESIQVAYTVDARRIYAIGHSNGAFMANTLACERPDLLAGVISVAGAANPACTPAGELSVLHVHATGDDSIFYEGGMLNGAVYPGAVGTAEYWAQANGCSLESEVIGAIDFNQFVPGAESEMARYIACPEGIDVDLWTEPGGPHMPRLPVGFYLKWWEWMNAHPKPE
jgi:polyhydroxybutyrate depolymerase